MVFCTQFVDGWCSWWWAYAPETCRSKETLINYNVASSWVFTLFHDADARSTTPKNTNICHVLCQFYKLRSYPQHNFKLWCLADRASQYIYLTNYPTWCTNFCFTLSFCSCLYMFRALLCSSSGGQNCITHPLVSSHSSEWPKIQFYKYEQIVVKFMCEFFVCDYCVLLTYSLHGAQSFLSS